MKFSGLIGFWVEDIETSPGIWDSGIIEKKYKGDMLSNRQSWQNSNQMNDSFITNNRIKIVADLFLKNNYQSIKYATINGQKVRVTSISFEHPSVILELGGPYNGKDAS